jgi:phosphoglycerate-specific signal transduction histidine kinase
MSAAHAVLVETPLPLEATAGVSASENSLRDLAHELRQPLSSMEAIAYYLEMTLPAEQVQARQYMWRLQQLVEQANAILDQNIGGTTRKPCGRAPSAGTQ